MKPVEGAPRPTGGSFLWPSVQLLHFSGDAKDQLPGQGLYAASALNTAHGLSAFGSAVLFPPQKPRNAALNNMSAIHLFICVWRWNVHGVPSTVLGLL